MHVEVASWAWFMHVVRKLTGEGNDRSGKSDKSTLMFPSQANAQERSLTTKAALVSLATSVPANVFLQKDVLAAAWSVFRHRFPEFERFSGIFSNTGIVKRHGVKPFEWYLANHADGLSGRRRSWRVQRRCS